MTDHQRQQTIEDILVYQRGVEPEDRCPDCGGWGRKGYGDTTTWRGGAGGQSITSDVCDNCWGSGNKNAPWANLKVMEATFKQKDQALRNIRLLVNRIVAEPSQPTRGEVKEILRFCEEGGVPAQILRGASPDPTTPRKR